MQQTVLRILAYPLAAVALAALWSLRPVAEERSGITEFGRVSWAETQPRVAAGEWLLVDARDEEHYTAQHIPGAISLPSHVYPEMLQFFAEDHGTEKTTVVYCGTEDCNVSTELAVRLRDEAGLADVRILDGGFLAWQRSQ
ncbi:MAG: rhodanese-like domain-containing protein [Chthoniobacterales bacterium]|nr:rhodanese-like domain-containing protein [Chthoniobacterales bacterium]